MQLKVDNYEKPKINDDSKRKNVKLIENYYDS